ncbi:hypothetical protein MKW94_023716 [Papaver nudicaule]|uniref:Uncharacterized protein n=1 Tax=Papaver nudicaule TaxID=74823 RepID=A0AA41VB95_PAPNU|nr:hypothetical protein [Papaver nudicaule]MCL7033385.1 hypothetical protein [Papaver nudicaule]
MCLFCCSEKRTKKVCCGGEYFRPLGFLLGLIFALLSLLVSIVGLFVWIVGLMLTCICPCCVCGPMIVKSALDMINAPVHVMEWFTSHVRF